MIVTNSIRKIIQTPATLIIASFKAGNRISSLFSSTFRRANNKERIVCGYSCYDCEGYFIGQTSRRAAIRTEEHKKAFRGKGYSEIAEHCLNRNHRNNWDTNILAIESNNLKRNIKESLTMD